MSFLGPQHQAILLAGGAGSSLFPLNHTGLPLALLPVANQPLITFSLRTLEEAGIVDVLVVRSCSVDLGCLPLNTDR
jgi:NDP-sugar pyrophosphorylase family protein